MPTIQIESCAKTPNLCALEAVTAVSLCDHRNNQTETALTRYDLAMDEYLTTASKNPVHKDIVYTFIDWVVHEFKHLREENTDLSRQHRLKPLVEVLPGYSYGAIQDALQNLEEQWPDPLPEQVKHMKILMELLGPAIEAKIKNGKDIT